MSRRRATAAQSRVLIEHAIEFGRSLIEVRLRLNLDMIVSFEIIGALLIALNKKIFTFHANFTPQKNFENLAKMVCRHLTTGSETRASNTIRVAKSIVRRTIVRPSVVHRSSIGRPFVVHWSSIGRPVFETCRKSHRYHRAFYCFSFHWCQDFGWVCRRGGEKGEIP